MSKREFIVILIAAIVLTIAVPIVVQLFKPRQAEHDAPPGVPFSASVEQLSPPDERLCTVRGRCVELLAKAPIEAMVTLTDIEKGPVVTWPCDEGGHFEFKFRPKQNLYLDIWKARHVSLRIPLPANIEGDGIDVGTVFVEPLCNVTFFIQPDGKRVSPERLIATRLLPLDEDGPLRVEVVIPRQGLPEASLRPGTWRASAVDPQFRDYHEVPRASGFSATFRIEALESEVELLPRQSGTASLAVRALNHRGEPLPKAHLTLEALGPDDTSGILEQTRSDGFGRTTFLNLPAGTYMVWASDTYYSGRSMAVAVSVIDGESKSINLTAECRPDVFVTVTREGMPWAGASVALVPDYYRDDPDYLIRYIEKTDASGIAVFGAVPVDAYVIRARADSNTLSLAGFSDLKCEVVSNHDIVLGLEITRKRAAAVNVQAQVRGAFRPVEPSDVLFGLRSVESPFRMEYRIGNENFAAMFDAVPPGEYTVWVRAITCTDVLVDGRNREIERVYTDLTQPRTVSVGEESLNVDVELEPGSLQGSVHLRYKTRVYPFARDGSLELRHPGFFLAPWLRESRIRRFSVRDGHFRLPELSVGRYEVLLRDEERIVAIGSVEIRAANTEMNLELSEHEPAELAIELQAEKSDPFPISEAKIVVRSTWRTQVQNLRDGLRSATFFVEQGKVTVESVVPDYSVASASVELQDGEKRAVNLKLEPLFARGRVLVEGIEPFDLGRCTVVLSDQSGFCLPTRVFARLVDGKPALDLAKVPLHATQADVYVAGKLICSSKLEPRAGETFTVSPKQ